jgi:hypothetical protein
MADDRFQERGWICSNRFCSLLLTQIILETHSTKDVINHLDAMRTCPYQTT